jgi:hypothetical protein
MTHGKRKEERMPLRDLHLQELQLLTAFRRRPG